MVFKASLKLVDLTTADYITIATADISECALASCKAHQALGT